MKHIIISIGISLSEKEDLIKTPDNQTGGTKT
jgi:hypothetical protein